MSTASVSARGLRPALLVATLLVACGTVPPESRASLAATAASASSPNAFATAADALVAAFEGTAGIWVSDPASVVPAYTRNPDGLVVTASLYKLAILAHLERLVEAKTLSYADTITIEAADVTADGAGEPPGTVLTVDDALEAMITYSDNGPALAFLRMFGATAINATLADQHIAGFTIAATPDDDNVVTPRALGTYFTLLAQRKLVSAAASGRMLARLERQHINDRLPRDLPAGTAVAHKTGDLVGLNHDAGIIQTSRGPRVAVALTSGGTPLSASDLIAGLGSLVYAAAPTAKPPVIGAIGDGGAGGLSPALSAAAALAMLSAIVLARRRRASRVSRSLRRASGATAVWSPDRRGR